MDFPIPLPTVVRFIPRGHTFPEAPKQNEMTWVNQYGFIGVVHTLPGLFVQGYSDGLNETGLSAACLWLEGTTYAKPRPGVPILYNSNLVSYILGNFKNIAEVEEALNRVTVLGIDDPLEMPTHIIASDASGNHLIIEFIDGEMKTHTSSSGILTNEPTYDWHQLNLQNFLAGTCCG
jgi:choloylglycine hydrolase